MKDIRFTEYTHKLLSSVLRNYPAVISYLKDQESNGEARSLLSKWTDKDTVVLAAILCDVLHVYKRFQKLIQGDNVTIFDVASARDNCIKEMNKILEAPAIGGFESVIFMCTNEADDTNEYKFKGVSLIQRTGRESRKKHLYVTSSIRTVEAIRGEILQSMINFLTTRFHVDSNKCKTNSSGAYHEKLKAFSPLFMKSGDMEDADIQLAQSVVAPDTNLQDFMLAYREVARAVQELPKAKLTIDDILQLSLSENSWHPITVAAARIIAMKPHSCDVERLVSAYNILKDDDRCSLNSTTVDAYLHVHVNMDALSKFDCRAAIKRWLNKDCSRRRKETPKAMQQEWFKGVF